VRSRSLTLPLAALAATLLAGCTFSVGLNTAPTLPAAEVAEAAEGILEAQSGVRPDIDCGADPIPVEEGGTVTCLLLDPVADLEFDVVMTFSEVDFPRYYLAINVADVPNNAPQPTVEPGASVPINEIESLAIRALKPTLDFVPEVSCEGTEVEIAVGNTVDCSYPSPDGDVDVVVTITQFDPTTGEYFINVA
jgi:hypothetical protein